MKTDFLKKDFLQTRFDLEVRLWRLNWKMAYCHKMEDVSANTFVPYYLLGWWWAVIKLRS